MDQEEDLDFKSLRAKFQVEEVLLKQPRTKPALPVKPKVLSPPHSPTNFLPSFSPTSHTPSNSHNLTPGARPSLLTSLQGKGDIAPRVIFKEKEKKVKGKDMNEGKVKLLGKKKAEADKGKADREMNGGKDDAEEGLTSDQKQKKEADLVMKNKKVSLLSPRGSKEGIVEMVDASPPPINATVKKKGFRSIGKPVKSGKKGKERKAVDPLVTSPSPQPERPVSVQERPLSALSALGRAEELSPPKKRGTERIFSALEKAKRKFGSPLTTPSSPVTSTIEDQPPLPHKSLPELPPIDYDDQPGAGPPTPLKPALVNSVDVRQTFPVLERIAGDVIPDLLVAPPPLSRRCLSEASTLRPLQEKPLRLPSMNLTAHAWEIPAPPEFSIADPALDVPEFELLKLEALEIQPADLVELEGSEWGNGEYGDNLPETVLLKQEILEEGEGLTEVEDHRVPGSEPVVEVPLEVRVEFIQETVPASPSSQDPQPAAGAEAEDGTYESCDNANEDMPSAKQKVKVQPTKKKKEPKSKKQAPNNPYTETQPPTKGTPRASWSFKRPAPQTAEEKELKKKEKQHLEKEKKEQKEREKKEQKEREKKENEMKKFKITGQEEAIYQATVTVASKGRKNNLAVKNRDIVSIIRTTNCPKGKWLARDSTNTYGYISVSQVELDIKEMLELGKKASHAISYKDSTTVVVRGGEVARMGSRTSNHYPLQEDTGSFTDDSEEWAYDDDEPLSYPIEEDPPESGHIQTMSTTGSRELSIHHQQTHNDTTIDGMDMQVKHEALQKLATFFHKPVVEEPITRPEEPEPISPVDIEEPVYPRKEEADLELPDMMILPPPGLYADDNQ